MRVWHVGRMESVSTTKTQIDMYEKNGSVTYGRNGLECELECEKNECADLKVHIWAEWECDMWGEMRLEHTHLPKLICDPVALARLGSPARVELGAGVVVGDEPDEPGAPAPFTQALLDAHLDLLMEDARDRCRVHFRHLGMGMGPFAVLVT